MLRIENVNKNFGKKVILKDINLTVKPGERVHIVGKNGCGKSTLFKIITGILKAQGQVKLDEEDYLGAMIENPGFLEYEAGLENLKFLANLNHHYDEAKVRNLMKEFSLDPDESQAVSKYSIGMRQKLGIIQAIMENQNIVLFDEPTRGIDKEGVTTFLKMLDRLKEQKVSVIIATHEDIAGLTYDRVLKLENGALENV